MISFPNAKINLGLFVTEKRDDGFHNLETLFFPIPFKDILEIVPSKDSKDTLLITGMDVPGDLSDNLVLKAVKLLRRKYTFPNLHINLHKLIPMGAGLGGGSADAAFTLLNINKQFQLNISDNELEKIALELGSDCPIFIRNKVQFAQGRGEIFTPIDLSLKGQYLLVVCPNIHVGTAEAFKLLNPKKSTFDLRNVTLLEQKEWSARIKNDFEDSVFLQHPELFKIKENIKQMGAYFALMSGSGSSVYGIFAEKPKDFSVLQHLDHYCFEL